MSKVKSQIIGSFEDIGKDIARETIKVPKDVGQKAMESMGVSTTKSSSSGANVKKSQEEKNADRPPDEWDNIDKASESKKSSFAREALKALVKRSSGKEASVYEKKIKEEEEKKDFIKKQKEKQDKDKLPTMWSKPKKGNIYGIKTKQSPTEKAKNVISG
ncbi:hypothetical protein ACFL1A_00515 [Patescibacteria group bacterium]